MMDTKIEEEYEIEESYVYVDFDSKLLDDQLPNTETKVRFLGMDTKQPIMQINNQLFKGHFDYAIGTFCFFREGKDTAGETDACFYEMPAKLYDYHSKSNKVLKMTRIFVEEEIASSVEVAQNGLSKDLDQLKIDKTYKDALNQFLQPDQVESDVYESSSDQSDPDTQSLELDTQE